MNTTPMPDENDLEAFLHHLRSTLDRAPTTVSRYRHVLSALFRRRVTFDQAALASFVGTLADGSPCEPSTRNHRLTIIRGFCRYLIQQGVLGEDPSEGIRRSRVPRKTQFAPSLDEVQRMLNSARYAREPWIEIRDEALLLLGFYTGLRLAEVRSLDLDQVDAGRRMLLGVIRKGGDVLDVPLHRTAAEALFRWLIARPSSVEAAVFTNRYGRRLSTRSIQKRIKSLGRQAGLGDRMHPHALRHAHATQLLNAGVPTAIIQKSLNHRSLHVTERYLHSKGDAVQRAVDRLPSLKRRPDG